MTDRAPRIPVILTRELIPGDGLVEGLERSGHPVTGLTTHEYETLEGPELHRCLAELSSFDVLLLTSPRGVRVWVDLCRRLGQASWNENLPVAVVGPGSARALREAGIEPLLEARKAHSEGLASLLTDVLEPVSRVLHAGNAEVRPVLGDLLAGLGHDYVHLPLYRGVPRPQARNELERRLSENPGTAVVVTAGSALEVLLCDGVLPDGGHYIALGPVTADLFERSGLPRPPTPDAPDAGALVRCLEALC